MSATTKPIVLVVDDDERTLELRVRQLRQAECEPLSVSSFAAALQQLAASPEVDAVLTDINLDATKPKDKSGVELGRLVRTMYEDLPVAAYSARFSDQPLSKTEREIFTRELPKGRLRWKEISTSFEELREDALSHRARRRERAQKTREVLKGRVDKISLAPAEVVRQLVPHNGDQASDIEKRLKAAGFSLVVVSSEAFQCLALPLLVWVRERDGLAEVEVYGQPSLYAVEQSVDKALDSLVELMQLFSHDFERPDAPESEGIALGLRNFLRRVVRRESARGKEEEQNATQD